MDTYDAIVIGSGVNGLVAAAELATEGWSVAIVEQNDRLGGFIDSGEMTLPGYTHDTYSSWHPLFVSGGAYATLWKALEARGLEYANTDGALTGSISTGRAALAYRDAATTAEGFEHPEDRDAYLAMMAQMGDRANLVFGLLGSEVRSGTAVNPNAVNGDPYWGSMELDQNLLWRPLPDSGKHTTVIKSLLHIGASTHPGGGLSGGAGHLAAQQVLTSAKRRAFLRK